MSDDLLPLLAGRRGHFCMESGYHSERWFELDRLFDDADRLQPFVKELAHRLIPHRPEAICGPVSGGAKLAALVAAQLNVPAFRTHRFESPQATGLFPVRYEVPALDREKLRGKCVAIVDDAISAGSAIKGTLASLLACGARPIACGALIIFGDAADRIAVEHQVALERVTRMSFGMWKPDDCPLCRAGIALEKISDAI
jgi:orotate phosphoribosyltransferase